MAFFTVTASNGSKALINSNMVNKVVDFGNCRAIYQGSDTNNFQVRESLSYIWDYLNSK
ncbi:hypothetical protein SALWKB2_0557 [Snodgrassella alvi wkB2]|uniref:Uncharacterized protein n=3 Tax=Snodgrassella alvi TaxID=1196083 RepID=A0ABD7Z405_9NEIS|nr:hypothetical protein [Snodgrassella alvi]AHN27939.1 hypothetical protein SALWKB2_0557 [Snodgrassella alvi wkB2]KEQ00513.1 hypothetical protein SASC598J21_016590 [Snodgrassella alvi SCGC AB-598-J21]UOO98903.1 hypothetical protein LVJ87_01290 [Snodgrassella alvi wkB2]WLS99232.1 hypothetical protein RAM05_04345 [Snodgrassella alvi]